MYRHVLILGCLFLTALFTRAALSGDSGPCDEPRIKFLDDLVGVHRRDPFEERIETERHDFTQSTKTVGYHVAQSEAGYSYFYNDILCKISVNGVLVRTRNVTLFTVISNTYVLYA